MKSLMHNTISYVIVSVQNVDFFMIIAGQWDGTNGKTFCIKN